METVNPLNNNPQKIAASELQIDERKICSNAKAVVNTLLRAGYQAYLVGGCVRDLLLGINPKDFDVATNARPEQICDLFNNARLIGRRFRLVHVYFDREFIEVSTFRALAKQDKKNSHTEISNGRIVRDNTFGSIEEDAVRRDFTVNAMYYDLENSQLLDFCNGLQDIEKRCLRMIGSPEIRYREDPVRMLRALRFCAKLNLEIEKNTAKPIANLGHLLKEVSSARLFDEVIKLFHSGHARRCFDQLEQHDLFKKIFTFSHQEIKNDDFRLFVYAALENTDVRIASGKSVNPAFIFAVLLWNSYKKLLRQYSDQGVYYGEAAWEAGRSTVVQQSSTTFIPKRFSIAICEIWKLQNRFKKKRGRKALQFMQHPRFRAAYDFMCLRTHAGEIDQTECHWWTTIQAVSPEEQRKMLNRPNKSQRHRNDSE